MDHLPQLRGHPGFEVRLFTNARFHYDCDGLQGFPARCSFAIAASPNLQTDHVLTAFFQSWLFFGTLVELFKVYDIPVQQDDFVSRSSRGHDTVTTKCLQDYIAAWITSASREYPGCLDRNKHYSTARMVGSTVGTAAGQAVNFFRRATPGNTTPGLGEVLRGTRQRTEGREKAKARATRIWLVLDTVATILRNFGPAARCVDAMAWDSVLVLCTTLHTAAYFIYRALPQDAQYAFKAPFNKLPMQLTPRLFRENGWCSREVRIITALVDGDHCALLLCAQLDRHNLDHSNCNSKRCTAYQVDQDTYQTQHCQDCHGCDFLGFNGWNSNDPASSKLLEAINCDASQPSSFRPTPMATYGEGQLRLVPVSVGRQPFVAISHVWADGLGNTHTNALPRCQLERIQSLVDKQFPARKGPVPFWMDTLCIPVSRDKPKAYAEAKKSAMKNMEGVYKSATKVLVLDRTLTKVSSQDMSKEEIGIRIMCSGWARRLWTLQEGLFQARVHYQFADITYTYKYLKEALRQKHAFPKRRVVVPETHFLRKYLENPPNCATEFDPLARFAHKPLSSCWPRISTFFKELDIKYSQPDPDWFPGMQLVPGMIVLVPRALRTIAYRTTSRTEDEGLILASLTDWRTGSAGHLIDMAGQERLRACFEQFAIVPSQLIFLNRRRYPGTGARWIPQSLLAQSATEETDLLAQSTEGIDLLSYEHAIISDEFSWPSPRGITAEYPSFRVTLPPRLSLLKNNQKIWLHLAGDLYTGFVHEAGSKCLPASLPSSLALIVPRSTIPGSWKCVAVLVSIQTIQDVSPSGPSRGRSGFIAGVFTRGRNVLANYHDKSRMIGRHESLIDLERVPEGQIVGETLSMVDTVLMTECLTPENNTRWRIG